METEEYTSQTTFVVCLSCHAADADRSRSETRGVLASNHETFWSPSLPCLFAMRVGLSKLTVNCNCNCKYCFYFRGHAVAQLVEALPYKPEVRGF